MAEVEEQIKFQLLTGDKGAAVALQAQPVEDLNKGENQPVFEAGDLVNKAIYERSSSLKLEIQKSDFIEDLQCCPLTDALRTCSECGKQFTSGKALGGHKRACQTSGELNICYVCQRGFRSLKSLYGHMRKHPEREWRGIQPPPQRENQCISSTVSDDYDHRDYPDREDEDRSSDNSALDPVETFKGWPIKGKRGHRLLISDAPLSTFVSKEGDDSEAMQQAVSDLMLLAQLCTNDRAVTSKRRGFDHMSSVGSGYGLLKIKEKRPESEDIGNKFEVEGGSDAQETKNLMCNSEDTLILRDYDEESEMEINNEVKQQKKKKKSRLNELEDIDGVKEDPIMTIQTYSCPLCNKVFDKHQALGGHVASHNKNKNVDIVKESSAASASASDDRNSNTNTDSKALEKDKQVVAFEETGDSSRVAAAAAGAAAGSEHQCNVCNKSFPTGQALGGHKRCHWTGPAEAFSSSSQVTTSTGEVTQRAPRVFRDFDLNDKPPEYYQFHGLEATATAS